MEAYVVSISRCFCQRPLLISDKECLPLTTVVQLSAIDEDDFDQRPLVATRNLHQSKLFTDAALIDLLDHSQVSFILLCRTVRQRTDVGIPKVFL
jgi:hypothetical protein